MSKALALLLLSVSSADSHAVYKCIDAQGINHYQASPCREGLAASTGQRDSASGKQTQAADNRPAAAGKRRVPIRPRTTTLESPPQQ